ncbi:MAG: tyrosine-type recombinase/integrase [Lachnospiraceae bacterium]|nr:tyrosine-type recombinase/integrase [Lachnospiraceae bacterium]MBQ9611207.1 tyrosine-type recombinase/integrase [Lachnospiraceae bacterium]
MPYNYEKLISEQLNEFLNTLKLINHRKRTVDTYLSSVSECAQWLHDKLDVSINDASVSNLRAFLVYLHTPVSEGGRGLMPRTVNVYNCAIKKYFAYVVRKELTRWDLPTMRIDHTLPHVPSKEDTATLLMGTANPKHRILLKVTYGCALRLSEAISLRFSDISFSRNVIVIRAENSKNRCEETVELPANLKDALLKYFYTCRKGASPEDWLFPGTKPGTHICKGTAERILQKRITELGWGSRGYTFHSLRHAHALHYYLDGADIYQVQIRLRHNGISATTIYVRLAGKLRERRDIANPFDDPAFKG